MTVTPGTVITARPWAGGKPLPDPARGIVLEHWGEDDLLVWFPVRGGPDEPGRAVQPILAREVLTVATPDMCLPSWVERQVFRLIGAGTWNELPADARAALTRAADVHTRRRPCPENGTLS